MKRYHVFSFLTVAVLAGLGVVTPARAGVSEDLNAFKTAANDLRASMVTIVDEATAKSNLSNLDAAITRYNNASNALDTSLNALDRSTETNARLYEATQTDRQTASDALSTEQVRLLASVPIAAVVAPELAIMRT